VQLNRSERATRLDRDEPPTRIGFFASGFATGPRSAHQKAARTCKLAGLTLDRRDLSLFATSTVLVDSLP
jgi:hypothetical protein